MCPNAVFRSAGTVTHRTMYIESSSDEDEPAPLPPPCNDTTLCKNVGGRCWFTSAMTFINKAYDDLPHNPLVNEAFEFSKRLVSACDTSSRQTLCNQAPKRLLDLYKQYLWKYMQHSRYYDRSNFMKMLKIQSPKNNEFWEALFVTAQERPTLMTARLSNPVGGVYKTLNLAFEGHVMWYDVLNTSHFNTKEGLAGGDGYVPYYVPGTTTFAPTTQPSGISFDIGCIFEDDPPTIVFNVTAADRVGVVDGGHGELLLAALYNQPFKRMVRQYTDILKIKWDTFSFERGVKIILVSKAALQKHLDLVTFVNYFRGVLAPKGLKLVGGLYSIDIESAGHQLSFTVCGDSGSVMVCDPNEDKCETVPNEEHQKNLYPTINMGEACVVVCREDSDGGTALEGNLEDAEASQGGPARKRAKVDVVGLFTDLAALRL